MKKESTPKLGVHPEQEKYNEALIAPVVTHKAIMDGGEITQSIINAKVGYSTKYWRQKADGEYRLCIADGGVLNPEISNKEKHNLKHYLAEKCRMRSFNGDIVLNIFDGMVRGITATENC